MGVVLVFPVDHWSGCDGWINILGAGGGHRSGRRAHMIYIHGQMGKKGAPAAPNI